MADTDARYGSKKTKQNKTNSQPCLQLRIYYTGSQTAICSKAGQWFVYHSLLEKNGFYIFTQ